VIITFDTNVLVRAHKRSDGPARKVVDRIAADPTHVIALSPFILGEVGKVLTYPRMQALYRMTADEIHDYVGFLRAVSEIVEPAKGIPVVLKEPADDPVIYTAVAAGADVLCTLNRDFYEPHVIKFGVKRDLLIMDDVALLELLEAGR
jgi:putative PIN family toxin of toxin-antitoxin system